MMERQQSFIGSWRSEEWACAWEWRLLATHAVRAVTSKTGYQDMGNPKKIWTKQQFATHRLGWSPSPATTKVIVQKNSLGQLQIYLCADCGESGDGSNSFSVFLADTTRSDFQRAKSSKQWYTNKSRPVNRLWKSSIR
jgi:hypothetical protein